MSEQKSAPFARFPDAKAWDVINALGCILQDLLRQMALANFVHNEGKMPMLEEIKDAIMATPISADAKNMALTIVESIEVGIFEAAEKFKEQRDGGTPSAGL